MPSSYAHYRFGCMAMSALPEEARRTVQRFRQLYEVGAHGPDLFFYYQPFFHTKMGELGGKFHNMSGKEFFGMAAAHLKEHPSEGGEAYLFGVLCHYALDSACHPLVCAAASEGKVGHTELETEMDRTLLAMDGEESPHTKNIASHMRLTWGECVTAAGFYPPASAYTIRQGVFHMRLINRVQALRSRKLVENVFRLGGASEMVMYTRPNRKCTALAEQLLKRYDQALANYPTLASQLWACIHGQGTLDDAFKETFG